MAVGRRIRYFRLRKNMTQKELGLLLGFSEKTAEVRVNQYENEYRLPKEDTLEKLGKIFHVAPDVFKVPNIDTVAGVMQTFFALEDFHGVRVAQMDNKLVLVVNDGGLESQQHFNHTVLKEWLRQRLALEEGKLSKEEYDAWRYNYTEKNVEEHLKNFYKEIYGEELF